MNIEEIQSAMDALVRGMLAKGVIMPQADFVIRGNEQMSAHLQSDYTSKCLDGNWLKVFRGETPEAIIGAAREYVSALISADEKVIRTYLGKLADAVDYGHTNGIAAEYVDPVRITQKAMSDNLLPAPVTAVDAAEPADAVMP